MNLMRANPLLGLFEGVGPENLHFFGPKWHSLCLLPFRAPKSLDFPGPLLPIVLGMDLPASKSFCPTPYNDINNSYRYINSYFYKTHFNLCVTGNQLAWHAGERDILHGAHQGESIRQAGDIPVARHQPTRRKGSKQGTVYVDCRPMG